MLAIETKPTDKLDMRHVLLNYCTNQYGRDQSDKVKPYIWHFSDLRQEIAGFQGRGGFDHSKQQLMRYLAACSLLEQRIPVGDSRGRVQLKFVWADAFRPRNKAALSSMAFEKAAVCFNLAAIHSSIGKSADRGSPEGTKEAIQNFQTAAGIFGLVRDQLVGSIQGSATADLKDATLSMCSSLMLAQAQSCFYEKAVKDRLNRSLLAKLANQTSQYYSAALNFAQQVSGQMDPSWVAHCRIQELAYQTAAHFQQAMAEKEKAQETTEGWGPIIARFSLAEQLCERAVELSKQSGLPLNPAALQQSIKTEKASTQKDNDTVYLELVPEISTLKPLEMVSTVKAVAVTLQDLSLTNHDAIQAFDRLVPHHVRAKADEFSARVQQLVAAVGSQVGQKTDEVSAFLAARGLPFAVDEQQSGIPDGLWLKVQEVQAKGGLAAVQETVSSLEKMAAEANGCLGDLQRKLEEEQDEDQRCRGRFPSQWTRLQSEQLNGNFFQSIKTYQEKLKLAEDANKSVYAKVETGKKVKDLFGKTREELTAAAPTSSSSSAESPQKQAVRASLSSLETSVKALQEKLDALKTQAAASDNITGDLMEANQQQQPMDSVIEKGMAALDPLQVEISQASDAVSRALTDLGGAWEAFKKQSGAEQDARTVWLGDLEKAATSLSEAQGEAAEGITFFNKLLDYLRTLKQQVDDFHFARQEERGDLLGQLSRQIAGMDLKK
uniref:BRO1 domain-containing protein n=1 Tax=Chromera velia CCMP2878 TaxID=1169474 RepID=A0A0G4I2X1_9ALVE|mmetsp:Transcript_55105/g.107769  ORF Transcript_55105/g.107769 Transcript_55105/m.107769 type:complete len:721 (+) Transcript_55105:170-2332(+)|eukprot:Cvel_10517.t1-p1 / transcript=Cvel_10517.t1 / gene=Cvel_10517 / organism=Chromera_velia_CCMP2878 / gene_product=ALG-2 interacting protein X, putative / transcript_product=ALG-2 interacting protein X, putative / location=Cvel_scaffold636:36573-42979(-) / protein_length=720 / sequence_SO=supercontig / SO=protein_coding / is_pseudo=false